MKTSEIQDLRRQMSKNDVDAAKGPGRGDGFLRLSVGALAKHPGYKSAKDGIEVTTEGQTAA